MTGFQLTAPATRAGLSERFEGPTFTREVIMTLAIGEGRDVQSLAIPLNDTRTLATIGKYLPERFTVTVSAVKP